jgi:hypothetical protein
VDPRFSMVASRLRGRIRLESTIVFLRFVHHFAAGSMV